MFRTSPNNAHLYGSVDETVWHTRKQRQQSEEQVKLMKNRLKLLQRDDEEAQKRIEMIKQEKEKIKELKLNHHLMIEKKKMGNRNEQDLIEARQRENRRKKEEQIEYLKAIKQATIEIKEQEHDKIKALSRHHSELIKKQQQDFENRNKLKREQIKETMHQSKSNVSIFWKEKLDVIKTQNEKLKEQNRKAALEQDQVRGVLTLEETHLLQKREKSEQVQRELQMELNRNKNLPHDEFVKKLHEEEVDVTFRKGKKITSPRNNQTKSLLDSRWLPTPEKNESNTILETEQKIE